MLHFPVQEKFLVKDLTYQELLNFHLSVTLKDDSELVKKRHCLELSQWMDFHKREMNSSSYSDLTNKYEFRCEQYVKSLVASGMAQQTIKNKLSVLNSFCRSHGKLLGQHSLPDDFCDALATLIERNKTCVAQVAKFSGFSDWTIQQWCRKEAYPSQQSLKRIERIEKFFELPPKTLTSRIKNPRGKRKKAIKGLNKNKTSYRKHISDAIKDPYAHRYLSWSDDLKRQFEYIYQTKTRSVAPDDEPRSTKWRLRKDKCKSNYYPYCQTATLYISHLERFFGYCLLPKNKKGLGLKIEDLSLKLLLDYKAFEDFAITFIPSRSNDNLINNASANIINFCSNMTTPGFGPLWHKPELFSGKDSMSAQEIKIWRQRCEVENKKYINLGKRLKTALEGKGKKSRDPNEAIRNIVNQKNPLEVLHSMVVNFELEEPAPYRGEMTRAWFYRDLLMLLLLEYTPLRALSLSIIKKDINLIRTEKGWRLNLSPDELKNGDQKAAKGGLDLDLPDNVCKVIDKYLELYYVFSSHPVDSLLPQYLLRCDELSQHEPMRAEYISDRILSISERYLPSGEGFSAQAFRHIITTHLIRNVPGGMAVAADVLLDDIKTVKKAYSHVKPGELHSVYADALANVTNKQ